MSNHVQAQPLHQTFTMQRLVGLLTHPVAGLWPLWVVLFALHFPLLQLLSGVQYGDAPRNLHWGLYLNEAPGFLFQTGDRYDHIKGFVPDPPSLAPEGRAGAVGGPLHRWWGPLLPLTWTVLWRVSHSYILLQLVIPFAASACVLLVWLLARHWFAPSVAAWAVLMVGWLPLFHEHAVLSYSEIFATFMLLSAFWAIIRERPAWAAVLGSLAVLVKLDMGLLYLGSIVLAAGWAWARHGQTPRWRVIAPAVLVPALCAGCWMILRYVVLSGPSNGLIEFQPGIFGYMATQMAQQAFYTPWYGSLLTLFVLGACCVRGWRATTQLTPFERALLFNWGMLGLLVLLIYMITRGASNSPRVLLPAWPPFALMIAVGMSTLPKRWFRRAAFYLLALFTIINIVVTGYQFVQARALNAYVPAWAYLRAAPEGVVMSEQYWATVLYARHPTTWFEFDEQFQSAVLDDANVFARYTSANKIRYIIVPDDATTFSPAVRAYLMQHGTAIDADKCVVYRLF